MLDPKQVVTELNKLGVAAVNLANDHSLDYGERGLQATLRALRQAGITPFGAGETVEQAERPFQLLLPDDVGGGSIAFYGSFKYSRMFDSRMRFYADSQRAGTASISTSKVSTPLNDGSGLDIFHVSLPYWGARQDWRSYEQYQIAHRLLRKGYHVVIGQGSPTLQEIERQLQRWIFYGLGNMDVSGPSSGRMPNREEESFPFGSWAVLEVSMNARNERTVSLKLYPWSVTENAGFALPESVDADQFQQIIDTLESRATNAWRFDNSGRTSGEDELGRFISFELGVWPVAEAPLNLPPLVDNDDPGNWTIQSAPSELVDSYLDLNKISMGASMYALQAERNGGRVDWLSARHAKITCGNSKFVAYGYVANESALGVTICSDKVLAAQFLMNAGVQTPRTIPVKTASGAVNASREIGVPVVVKPSDGKKSRGVTTDLKEDDAIQGSFGLAKKHGTQVLVQQHVETEEEVRVIATPEKAIAVIKRVLPHVVGDGVSSIRQLIEDKNLQRELNPSLRKRPIPLDAITVTFLEGQNYEFDDVPEAGEWVTVRNVAGLSAGADPHEAFESTDQKVKDVAAGAVAAIPGLDWGGVDVIIEKETGEPYVVEINTDAGFGQAMFPTYGMSRNVAEVAWDARYKAVAHAPTGPAHIPSLRSSAERVLRKRSKDSVGYSRALLSTTFGEFLWYSEYSVTQLSPRVMRVTSSTGVDLLITKNMMTALDRSSATRVLRHHSMVRKLLALDEVPQPRGREVGSVRGLQNYVKNFTRRVVLTPPMGAWMTADTNIMKVDAACELETIRPGTLVQTYRRGTRMRVLASQSAAFAVLAAQYESVVETAIARASERAVSAVRALPELRWAAVYVLVLPSGNCLVEGLSLNPRFTGHDVVVAGDVDEFFTWIVEDSSAGTTGD